MSTLYNQQCNYVEKDKNDNKGLWKYLGMTVVAMSSPLSSRLKHK